MNSLHLRHPRNWSSMLELFLFFFGFILFFFTRIHGQNVWLCVENLKFFFNQVLSSIFTIHIELRKVHFNRDGTENKILKVLKPLGLGRRVPAEVNCKP